uniref:Secreted protein n=1 Tax=Angiostrongylus cantonensis TaxID=6313 RepID=A0A0K0D0C5_ANGCA
MLALLIVSFIVKCNGDATKVYREIGEQKFIHSASSHLQLVPHIIISSGSSPKTRSRVFRNVQVPLDESTPLPSFNYDEGNHHLNKLSEDKRTMEEAVEYAKGLERTTISVRRDAEKFVTTVTPVISSQNIPAIITLGMVQVTAPIISFTLQPPHVQVEAIVSGSKVRTWFQKFKSGDFDFEGKEGPKRLNELVDDEFKPNLSGLLHGQLTPQIHPGVPPAPGIVALAKLPNQTIQLNPMTGFSTGVQIPQGQFPPVPQVPVVPIVPPVPPTPPRPFTSPIPSPILQPHPPLPGQVQPPQEGSQVSMTEFPAQGAVPQSSFSGRVEVINGQAANSSLEQLGCGFDWLTNTCKDVFVIGWCGQCHDFGNIFMHDCKCVRPLISLPPRQPVQPTLFFNMI